MLDLILTLVIVLFIVGYIYLRRFNKKLKQKTWKKTSFLKNHQITNQPPNRGIFITCMFLLHGREIINVLALTFARSCIIILFNS